MGRQSPKVEMGRPGLGLTSRSRSSQRSRRFNPGPTSKWVRPDLKSRLVDLGQRLRQVDPG